MLSAKKEDPTSAVHSLETPPSMGTPRNIVVSIQGLQQRLGDFSLEEVADAENKTKTLLLRLSELHCRLASLAAIKRSITIVGDTLEQANIKLHEMITDETSSASLHPQETTQASNLIKFPLGVRLAQQNTRQILRDTIPTMPPVSEPAAELARVNVQADSSEQTTSFVLVNPSELSDISSHYGVGDNSSTDESQNLGFDPVAQMQPAPLAEHNSLASEDLIDASALNQGMGATAAGVENSDSVTSADRLPAKSGFDQQLLDDLIKNYGEFVSSPDTGVTAKPQADRKTTAGTLTAKIILEPPSSASVANPSQRPLPVPRREGEIDRELKKIIKDYGEYDIYSRQNPLSLKLGVIGAFFLLAAVFSGFYFFSSARTSNPAVTEPATIMRSVEKGSHNQDNSGGREMHKNNVPPMTEK
jgi:hypothetical protein